MPPRKNAEKEPKISVEKPTKKKEKRVKQEKPKLNPPTILKVKIPSIKSTTSPCKVPVTSTPLVKQTAKQTKAINAAQRKLEWANEVALAQLIKPDKDSSSLLVANSLLTTEIKAEKNLPIAGEVVKKKRGRKKKVVETSNGVVAPATVTSQQIASENEPNKPAKKKRQRKRKVSGNENSDIISEEPKRKQPKKTATKKPVTKKTKPDSTSKSTVKKKLTLKRKPKIDKLSSNGSTSLLDNRALEKEMFSEKSEVVKEIESHLASQKSEEVKEIESPLASPAPVSRQNSFASDSLSWTKDISSSSATTCVTVKSNNFVQIDKRLPVVRLDNIDKDIYTDQKSSTGYKFNTDTINTSSSESDSDSSDSLTKCTMSSSSKSNSLSRSLNLSRTPPSSINSRANKTCDLDEIEELIDLDFLNELAAGYEEFTESEKQAYMELDWPEDIRKTITLCQQLRATLFEDESDPKENNNGPAEKTVEVVNSKDAIKNKSFEPLKITAVDNISTTNYVAEAEAMKTSTEIENQKTNESLKSDRDMQSKSPNQPTKQSENIGATDWYREKNYNYGSDDDDILSLTAESITGLESSRIYSSAASVCGIPDSNEFDDPLETLKSTNYFKPKEVCEKQNADSTSLPKEIQTINEPSQEPSTSRPSMVPTNFWPILLSAHYKPSAPTKCRLFKGVCIFNLMSNCQKPRCMFSHDPIEQKRLLNRMDSLPDEVLISDYMLIRGTPDSRRQFGYHFARTFIKRGLTRAVVEMVIDFIVRARTDHDQDNKLRIAITEIALEHLNHVDLNGCQDLLFYTFSKNKLLIDKLMEALVETQNFSRFKEAFVKLTDFMIAIGRSFDVAVARQILLRVCILPYDPARVKSLWQIVSNTDEVIFGSASIHKFEEYILKLDRGLHEEFLAKKQIAYANQPVIPHLSTSQEFETEKSYTSPDTTNMDNSHKPQQIKKFNLSAPVSLPNFKIPCLSAFQNNAYRPPQGRGQWRGYRGRPRPSFPPRMRPDLKRQVSYQMTASKFPRRTGPPGYY